MTDTLPSRTSVTGKLVQKDSVFRGLAISIIISAVFPYIIYILLKSYTSASDLVALVIAGVPPALDTIVEVIRKRRVDLIAGLSLVGIVVGIVLLLLGGSPRVYLIRESFFTAAVGLAYLVSFLFPRPLAFYFARTFSTGNVPEKIEVFDSLWQYPQFRRAMRVSTAVWGIGFVLEAVIRTFLVIILTTGQFLLISPFVLYGFIGGIALWTFWSSRQGRKRMDTVMAERLAEQQEAPAISITGETPA
jgi:hypothetical protein